MTKAKAIAKKKIFQNNKAKSNYGHKCDKGGRIYGVGNGVEVDYDAGDAGDAGVVGVVGDENDDSDDSDGSISSDDIDSLEEEYLGYIIDDQYIIIKYIGKGTFSRVWLVFDLINETFIIFKIYLDDDRDEFETELKTLDVIKSSNMKYNLNYKGHLIHEFNFVNSEPELCYILIMPYLGLSLCDILDNVEQLSLLETKYVIKNILNSLRELHQYKYVHTDLKTDNILTDIYLDENTEYIEWFKTLDIPTHYKTIFKLNSPCDEDMIKLDKNKRKKLKRKIKVRSIKTISSYVKKKLNNYESNILNINDIDFNIYNDNSDDGGELTNPIDYINDFDLDKINLNEVGKQQTIEEKLRDKELEDNDDDYDDEYDIINTRFTLIDYSNAMHIDDIEDDDELQIRAYRSPENILGIKYSYYSELWAVGCILWDVLTGDYIFEPELTGSVVSRDIEQLGIMETYLGEIPKDFSFKCERFCELFDDSGKIKNHLIVQKVELENVLKDKRPDLKDNEISEICVFLKKIWQYNPKDRLNINQIINDAFLVIG
jgi:serine/threonine-protein kinase SRPK3